MASGNLLGDKLRAWSIASLASGMIILCLLALFFPALRAMVHPPVPPEPGATIAPSPAPVSPSPLPSMSWTPAPSPKVSAPLGDDGQQDWPDSPNWVDPNPPPEPADKR